MTSGESQQPAGVNTMPSELATRIRGCTACDSLPLSAAVTVRPFIKPCSEFDIYTSWKPEHVSLVFIAEAPPGNSDGYFYDPRSHPGYREILRTALFDLLRLEGTDNAARLATFKARGYVLIDAVKCRCKKTGPQPPSSVTKTCATKWLRWELEQMGSPNRICLLGKTALLALSEVDGFDQLSRYSVTSHCGQTCVVGRQKVLIWPFPSKRNAHIYRTKLDSLREFCRAGVQTI